MDERLWRSAVRLVSGEASPAEREELRIWMEADPAHAAEVEGLRAAWEAVGPARPSGDPAAAWQRVSIRTGVSGTHPAEVLPLPATRRAAGPRPFAWRTAVLRAAAVLVLGVAAALATAPGRSLLGDRVLRRSVATGKGQQLQLVLDDGTHVRLGVSSRLSYPRWFRGHRDVRLEGAAYFEVAHDARHPFTVYTADAVTRVLGTSFSVRDYAGSEPARITVTEGRVAVQPARAPGAVPAILVKGEAAEVSAAARTAAVVRRADERSDLAWTRGTITFQNAPVRDVAAEVSRWYDVDLQVPDADLAGRHLTISFDNEPLDTVLEEMAAALNARVERHGLTVVLTQSFPSRRDPSPSKPAYSL